MSTTAETAVTCTAHDLMSEALRLLNEGLRVPKDGRVCSWAKLLIERSVEFSSKHPEFDQTEIWRMAKESMQRLSQLREYKYYWPRATTYADSLINAAAAQLGLTQTTERAEKPRSQRTRKSMGCPDRRCRRVDA